MRLRKRKSGFSKFAALIILLTGLFADANAQETVVRFHDNDELLINPGKGFMTFQRFNGDTLNYGGGWTEGSPIEYQDFDGNLENIDYPQTSIAYFRVYWSFAEPEQGKYNWEMFDKALGTARERGQKLMLRLAPYGGSASRDVPVWYREMVGDNKEWAHERWLVDPEDPRFVEHYGGMIRALGERYDGHPDIESVDLAFMGPYGEGAGTSLLTDETMQALVDSYLDTFTKTPLKAMLHGDKAIRYATSKANVGWRQDCLGDMGFWAEDPGDWNHMFDYYPQTIIQYEMEDAWKKAPVSFEICGTFQRWEEREGYGLEEAEHVFDQSLKWKISSFNAKSSAVPEEWQPAVDEWIKKMGYRFVLRRFSYPREVTASGKLNFTSWWENKGVAPIYHKYPLALRLRNNQDNSVLLTDVDIREWMPGDNMYNDAVFVPNDLPLGEYELELALIDPQTLLNDEPKPAVKLPIDARTEDGWYSLGTIRIK